MSLRPCGTCSSVFGWHGNRCPVARRRCCPRPAVRRRAAPAHSPIPYSRRSARHHRAGPARAAILFEIASARPMVLTFRFQPDMLRMWPAAGFGVPDVEWVKQDGGGYYVLHTNDPDLSAAVAMPRTRPGILAPYQERPKTYPT